MKLLFLMLTVLSTQLFAKNVYYTLNVDHKTVNISGKSVSHALAINDSIPAPTLNFNLGDTAIIKVNNKTDEPTTMHWHGLLLPWDQDGPQFSNTRIIEPGKSHTFKFPIKHTGTYWYHSHTELQEQRGLYGAIVIDDGKNKYNVDHDLVVVLSDWIDEHPQQVLSNLKADGDFYAFKKRFFPSIWSAIRHGQVWDYIKSEWTKMGPMDLSDVGYDAFLVNGQKSGSFSKIKPGDKVKLRVINASASTYFYLNLGKLFNFDVVEKDGVAVTPVKVNEILMGIAETYDITFTMPKHKALEFRATAQDITGYSSLVLGTGHHTEKVPDKMRPMNPFKMDHGSHGGGHGGGHAGQGGGHNGGHGKMNHGANPKNAAAMPMTKRLDYSMLKSPKMTMFDPKLPRRNYHLELNGDMERYTWTINGKSFSEDKYLMVKYGEVVRIHFKNKTMMHHPMHLHGHFFRVLNGQGHFAPNFHTVDVSPMGMITIEFHANEPGIWFLHCHNLYHMKMGMARLVKYEGFKRPQSLKNDEKKWKRYMTHDNAAFTSAELGIHTNSSELEVKVSKGRYQVDISLEVDKYDPDNFEAETFFRRYVNRFLNFYTGTEYDDQQLHAVLGTAYTVPFRVEVETHIRSDGKLIVNLRKSFPVASRVSLDLGGRGEFGVNDRPEWEFESGVYYQTGNRTKIGVNYQYNENIGHSVGVGAKININGRKKNRKPKK